MEVKEVCAHRKSGCTPIREMEQIKVGDTIKCHDKDDCVNYVNELAKCGIETDFLYEKDGEYGLWLVVTKTA